MAVVGFAIPALAGPSCRISCADEPTVGIGNGALSASLFEVRDTIAYASNTVPAVPEKRWRLWTQCQVADAELGACQPGLQACAQPPDRVVNFYIAQSQRLVRPDGQPVDGVPPPVGVAPGSPYGQWATQFAGCVDVTDLNPPPSPGEVFRYFESMPLPQLTTRQQPPGEALVGLPVIFFTDSPTTQTFTVDIRGFDVLITARAVSYTWRTGDGTTLTTTYPGTPYPDQTITHEYSSGTYTASLTTTWGATYSVDGGVSADVPGTTTTDGAPATFTVRQARSVLTSPYD
jgi:hypothetical protein